VNSNTSESNEPAVWVESELKRLDIGDTALLRNRGADGSRHADCTR
jgi:hypothetical protein